MNFENFDFKKFDALNINEQKQYFTKYFFPLSNGSHCMLKDGQYEIIQDDIITKLYLTKCGKKIKEYYREDFKEIKTPVYKLGKPVFFEDKINLCPQLPTPKPYKDFTQAIKDKVDIYLSYMKEVMSSSNEEVYQYLLKWNANMCKGNKNDSALVLKTVAKGVGKSTHPIMMRKYVLGENLSLESGSEPLKKCFNTILGGKLFVYFEELETFSANEWVAVSSVLKRQITSDTMVFEKKCHDSYTAENINNYILLSNHDVDDDGRRFFVADISTHRKGDREYWDRLYKNCFNEEVGFALYCYFREVDTTGFFPQDFPMTNNKLHSISKRLDSVYSFLKHEYVLKNTNIECKLGDFYAEYCAFNSSHNKKSIAKTDFISRLKEIQINFYKSNSVNKYKVSFDDLKKIADKNNWINEFDEFDTKETTEYKFGNKDLDHGLEHLNEPNTEQLKIQELEKELEALKKKYKKVKSKLKQANTSDE